MVSWGLFSDHSENITVGGLMLFDFHWRHLGAPSTDWKNQYTPFSEGAYWKNLGIPPKCF